MARVLCIGQAVQDFVFNVDSMPCTAEKYRASGFETVGGGPAATAAVAIARLGGDALLGARVGDDRIGDVILSELKAYDVDCALLRRVENRRSSLSAVLVDARGERMIVNYLDETMESAPDWLPRELPDDVSAVLTDTRWPEGALHALELARRGGLPAVLDADLPVPPDTELVPAATHVAFSAGGLAEFSGHADPEAGLLEAASLTDAWCCVTLGAAGTLFVDDGRVNRVDAFSVEVGDTLGAGDVWHGAFALALAEGRDLHEALVFASAAAALKVRNGGGRAGSPQRPEVERFLHRRGRVA